MRDSVHQDHEEQICNDHFICFIAVFYGLCFFLNCHNVLEVKLPSLPIVSVRTQFNLM